MSTKLEERIKQKSEDVSSLAKEISDFGSFLVFEYLGLDTGELTSFRKQLRESGSKLVIKKNNILNRALVEAKIQEKGKTLSGPNALLLTKKDIKPLQTVAKLAKEKEFLKLKLAYFDNVVIEDKDLSLLASLGSKEDLIVRFAQTILSPLYKFAYVVKNIQPS